MLPETGTMDVKTDRLVSNQANYNDKYLEPL